MSEHTTGPWRVSKENGEVYSPSEHRSVAMVLQAENFKANARLIACAPELLAALKRAKEVVDVAAGMTSCRSDDEFVWGAQDLVDAAIAKAEGGAA